MKLIDKLMALLSPTNKFSECYKCKHKGRNDCAQRPWRRLYSKEECIYFKIHG